jgi:hypothetical protein
MKQTKHIKLMIGIAMMLFMNSSVSNAQISWTEKFPWVTSDGTEFNFLSFSCSDKMNCSLLGYFTDITTRYSTIFVKRSTDGGLSWVDQSTGVPDFLSVDDAHLKRVYTIDSENVVAVGDSGLIVRTTDAGNTWIRQGKQLEDILQDVSFADSLHGIAVGGGGDCLHYYRWWKFMEYSHLAF